MRSHMTGHCHIDNPLRVNRTCVGTTLVRITLSLVFDKVAIMFYHHLACSWRQLDPVRFYNLYCKD